VQKFSLGRGDADDLVALARTIEVTADILRRLKRADDKETFAPILKRLNVPTSLAKTIVGSIDEDGLRRQQAEVADVAAALSQAADTDEMTESTKEALLPEVVEVGAKKTKKGRKRRISRGIENSIKSAALWETEGDEAWVMKKTFVWPPYTDRENGWLTRKTSLQSESGAAGNACTLGGLARSERPSRSAPSKQAEYVGVVL